MCVGFVRGIFCYWIERRLHGILRVLWWWCDVRVQRRFSPLVWGWDGCHGVVFPFTVEKCPSFIFWKDIRIPLLSPPPFFVVFLVFQILFISFYISLIAYPVSFGMAFQLVILIVNDFFFRFSVVFGFFIWFQILLVSSLSKFCSNFSKLESISRYSSAEMDL